MNDPKVKSYNAADEEGVKSRKRKDESARDRELHDLRTLMQSIEGRRFIWRLLDRAGVFRTSFTGNSTTFFNEGQRNMGLIVLADVHEACAEHPNDDRSKEGHRIQWLMRTTQALHRTPTQLRVAIRQRLALH
jgi:hypothetical protein